MGTVAKWHFTNKAQRKLVSSFTPSVDVAPCDAYAIIARPMRTLAISAGSEINEPN